MADPEALTAARGSGLLWLSIDDRPKEALKELGVDDRKFVNLHHLRGFNCERLSYATSINAAVSFAADMAWH